jgi:hypothetical protein
MCPLIGLEDPSGPIQTLASQVFGESAHQIKAHQIKAHQIKAHQIKAHQIKA